MSRFNDATTTWFTEGEDPDKLASLPEVLVPLPRPRWPAFVAGAVTSGVLVVVAAWGLGRLTPAPAPLAIPAAHAEPPQASTMPEPADTAPVPAPEETQPAPAVAEPPPAPVVAEPPAPAPASPKRAAKKRAKVSPEVLAGERLLRQRRYAGALHKFQRVLQREPKNGRALRGACLALDHLGKKNHAARVCRHALMVDPKDVAARMALANIYYTGGAYQWSVNEWRRILAERPNDTQARRGLRLAQARL